MSIFNAEEVRSAVQGGAEIIDCEDPQVVMGFYAPHTSTEIAYAVRQSEGTRRIPVSVNIGADLSLYLSSGSPRLDYEIQARAAQQALGMAAAMDVGDGRPNIIKFGMAGVRAEKIAPLVAAVKKSVRDHPRYQNHPVIAGFQPFDWQEWNQRHEERDVVRELVQVREYVHTDEGLSFQDFFDPSELEELSRNGLNISRPFRLTTPVPPQELGIPSEPLERMRRYVDEAKQGGADGVLMDTPIQGKVARICLVDHPRNAEETAGGTRPKLHGLYKPDALQTFADYCAYQGMESWIAGSITPFHAEAVGKLSNLDVVLCRGAASEVVPNPFEPSVIGAGRNARRATARRVSQMVQALRGTP